MTYRDPGHVHLAWVSTPPVTSRPASAIVGMSSPFLPGTGMTPQGTGRPDRALLGQQRSGSYQVTAVPAPRVTHPAAGPRPAVRAQDTLTRSAACRARPGTSGRMRQASMNRSQIAGRHTGKARSQPHPHHSEEVLRARSLRYCRDACFLAGHLADECRASPGGGHLSHRACLTEPHCRNPPYIDQGGSAAARSAPRAGLEAPLARSRPLSAPSRLLKWLIPAFPSIRRRPEPVESATRCCAKGRRPPSTEPARESPVLAAIGDVQAPVDCQAATKDRGTYGCQPADYAL
jgi:hypothetical protein